MSVASRLAALIGLLAPAPLPAQSMPGMDMSAHEHMRMSAPPPATPADGGKPEASGTDLPLSDRPRPAPPPPKDRAADAVYGAEAMAGARTVLVREHGGMTLHQIVFNLAEAQVRRGRDGYRWDGEGWWGGDVDRFVAKSEGEGDFGGNVARAEIQALYSHAIGPYYNLQAGLRQDLGRGPRRTYATVGLEGLAPYWFQTEGRLFLSAKGDLLARAEAWYDQRVTQRLVLQPRVELNFAAQDVAEQRLGRGLSDAELGLRLRYEIRRQFAPYVGLSWERSVGRTARFTRAAAAGTGGASALFGIRAWF